MLMDEQGRSATAQGAENTSTGARWANLRCLAILVLLAVSLRVWQITHTEVASRDSIGYIRIAWQLEQSNWREVIPRSSQHPAYPLAVLATSIPVRYYLPDDLPLAWQLSSQLASALAGVLLVVPMFYLGRELFDRRVAFWACVLFQCLPTSGKVMGDGLSEPLFLLFASSAFWLACVALRRGSWRMFALTGLAGGLAYLTRPEGALILGATGLVLLALQLSRTWRRSWKSVLINGAALSLAALVVMGPYVLAIGGLTVKNTPLIMLDKQRKDADWEGRTRPQTPHKQGSLRSNPPAAGSTLLAIWWMPTLKDIEEAIRTGNWNPPPRYLWALKAMGLEMSKAFFYVAWLPALLGLWWFRDRFRRVPGAWVMLLVCMILTGVLYRMAEKMGYLSDRHLLLVVLFGCYWAVAAVGVLGAKLASGLVQLRPTLAGSRWADRRILSLGLLLLLTIAPLFRTLERLHAERAGFRVVGQWLAEHTWPGDFIEDPYCWTNYYAGRVFLEGREDLPTHQPPCYYVVLEQTKNKHPHLVSRQVAEEHVSKNESKLIHLQHVRRGKQKAEILVYRVLGNYDFTPPRGLPGVSN
jgi:hypothetical protein